MVISQQQHELSLDFGKNRGRYISEVDAAYLQWMLKSFCESSQWQKAAARVLIERRKLKQKDRSMHALLDNLKVCISRRDLQSGRNIHAKAVELGSDSNIYLATALIRMYAKCGSMADARLVFDKVRKPDLVCWTALLLGYAENGEGRTSLELFSRMKDDGYSPDSVTYVAALKACKSLVVNEDCTEDDGLEIGRKIHLQIGDHLDLYVQNTLIDMYSNCGSMTTARKVFDTMENPDVVSWNALIMGYAENGQGHVSLDLFSKMKARPNSVTYVAVLKACTSLAVSGDASVKARVLEIGCHVHSQIGGHRLDLVVQNTLVDMYAKCGSMLRARQVFDTIQKPDTVSWTALAFGYSENGEGQVFLELLSEMKAAGCLPSSMTYVAALKACAFLALNGDSTRKSRVLATGSAIHLLIGANLNPHVQSALIDMYSKCGSMSRARQVFDSIRKPDLVSTTALLSGYADNGKEHIALELFSKMKAGGCVPNSVTYVAVLKACTSLARNGDSGEAECLEIGSRIHSEIGGHLNAYVQSTLIDMYANCGSMDAARWVFSSLQTADVVCWNALLLGYAENGEPHVTLDLFSQMKSLGCAPDSVTYIAVLKACGSLGTLALGRQFHKEISEFTVRVVTCLADFYAKCGSMVEARATFDEHLTARDITTWNALLAGYSSCGDTASVFNLFEEMQDVGFRPDGASFVCLLSCCSHSGLLTRASEYLKAMPVHYGVTPEVTHYNCLVDMLARANQLSEAVSALREMPCSPNAVAWSALLSACRKWKNVEIGKMAFQALVEEDKEDASAYLVMAHI